MMMIPVLHVLERGGVLNASGVLTTNYCAAWLLNVMSYCAVNTYGLISGYVGYGRKHRWSSFLILMFQVLFYTITTTVAFVFIKPEAVNLKVILGAIIPFAYESYWYYTAYFCLFFIMPYLDILIDRLTKIEAQKMLIATFLSFLYFLHSLIKIWEIL